MIGALRPLLAEVMHEHGERLLVTAGVVVLVVLVVEAGLHLGMGDGGGR